jgi:hypothetical protein
VRVLRLVYFQTVMAGKRHALRTISQQPLAANLRMPVTPVSCIIGKTRPGNGSSHQVHSEDPLQRRSSANDLKPDGWVRVTQERQLFPNLNLTLLLNCSWVMFHVLYMLQSLCQ